MEYSVKVTGVQVDGETRAFSWATTVFDPNPSGPSCSFARMTTLRASLSPVRRRRDADAALADTCPDTTPADTRRMAVTTGTCCEELRLAGISHLIAGDYTLGGKHDGHCYYSKGAGDDKLFLFWHDPAKQYRVASALESSSLYAYARDPGAGRPQDIDVEWQVFLSPWQSFPLTLRCTASCDEGFLRSSDGATCVLPPVPCPMVTIAGRAGFNSGINGDYALLGGFTNGRYAYDHVSKGPPRTGCSSYPRALAIARTGRCNSTPHPRWLD